jgi:phage gpG-like protein
MAVGIGVDLRGLSTFLAKVAKMPGAVQNAAFKAMGVVGRELEKHVKVNHLSGQSLDVRTGNLRRAIFHEVGRTIDGDAFAKVGADKKKAPYAPIHELGGIIRPKKSRHLTIPLSAAQTRKGVAKFSARDVIGNPTAFGYVGTFTHNKIIFGKKSDGGIEPLFKLADQVTIKAVGYLTKTAAEKKDWVQRTVQQYVGEAFKKSLE